MTEVALHRAIIENPDDDLPRLALADWLDENGQPERAELIRVQVGLAREPDNEALRLRERDLLAAHQEEWVRPLGDAVTDWVLHRGMLGVATDVTRFLAYAELLARSPLVHYIDIADHAVGREAVTALARLPELSRVTILDLAGWYCYDPRELLVDDEQTAALAISPFVSGLEVLNLRCNAIRDDGVRALATSPHLGRLKTLDLRANLLGDEGVKALAGSSDLRELVSLDLSFNDGRVTDDGWRSLADARSLPGLRGLGLVGNRIGEGVKAALRARFGSGVVL